MLYAQRRSAGATAPIRFSMSASIWAPSWRRLSAARWARTLGWHYGFGAAGVGMLLGIAVYIWGWKRSAAGTHARQDARRAAPAAHQRGMAIGRRPAAAGHSADACTGPATSSRATSSPLVARHIPTAPINLFGWHTEIPFTWFQSLNPFMIFVFTPLYWRCGAGRDARQPSSMHEDGHRLSADDAANLLMAWVAWHAAARRIGCGCWLFRDHDPGRDLSFSRQPVAVFQGGAAAHRLPDDGVWCSCPISWAAAFCRAIWAPSGIRWTRPTSL